MELVRRLINAGVNVNGMNEDGHTPLYIALHHDDNDSTALQEKRQQVAALLVKAGAKEDKGYHSPAKKGPVRGV